MTLDRVDRPTLLLFADRLEAQARALPRWDPSSSEPWHELVERQYQAELALAQQLHALRGCQLSMCAARAEVRLNLLGVRVQTKQGLADACQLWVERVRAQLGCLAVHALSIVSTLSLAL
jgi:hypothetical protein